eukprot:6181648-Pyramimonas_sp.AAC.1
MMGVANVIVTFIASYLMGLKSPFFKSFIEVGIFLFLDCDWRGQRVYSFPLTAIGVDGGYDITLFYGSSCANNGKDALNTPDLH